MENIKNGKLTDVAKNPIESDQLDSSMPDDSDPSCYLFGCKNIKGEVVIPARFDMIGQFEGFYARVELGRKWGVIDAKGNWCFKPKFDFIGKIENGAVSIRENKLWGVADLSGHVRFAPRFDEVVSIGETVVTVRIRTEVFVINFDGKIIKSGFQEIYKWSDGYAVAIADRGIGLLSESGEWLVPPSSNPVHGFSEGFAAFGKDGKYGYYNSKGAVGIEPIFDVACDFSEGLARVRQGDKFGYIDYSGKIVIPCTWGAPEAIKWSDFNEEASRFINGFAIAAQFIDDGQYLQACYIDRDGKSYNINDQSIYRRAHGLQRFSIENPKFIEQEKNSVVSPAMNNGIEDFKQKFEYALEQDSATVQEAVHFILSKEVRPEIAYFKINLATGNEYGLTLYPCSSDGEEDIGDGLPELKAVAKVWESSVFFTDPSIDFLEPENTKEENALNDALDASSQLIKQRFSELWNKEGGDKYPIPVYIQEEDDSTWMDLKTGEISEAR